MAFKMAFKNKTKKEKPRHIKVSPYYLDYSSSSVMNEKRISLIFMTYRILKKTTPLASL